MAYPEDFDELVLSDKSDFDSLAPSTRIAYCLHQLEAEVNNGGVYQFFSNSSGEYVPETLQALSDIGAPRTRALLEQAVAIAFPGGYPADPTSFADALADFDDVADGLEPLDAQFFVYAEPLADLTNHYLARIT